MNCLRLIFSVQIFFSKGNRIWKLGDQNYNEHMINEPPVGEPQPPVKKKLWKRPVFWVLIGFAIVIGLIATPFLYLGYMTSEGSNWSKVMETSFTEINSTTAQQAWLRSMEGSWEVEENGTVYTIRERGSYLSFSTDGESVIDQMRVDIVGENYAYVFPFANEEMDDIESLTRWGTFYEVSFESPDRMSWTGPHDMAGRSLERGNKPTIHLARRE